MCGSSEHMINTRAGRALEVSSCSPALGAEGAAPAPTPLHCPPGSTCEVLPGAHPIFAGSDSAPGPLQLSISGNAGRPCSNPRSLASDGQNSFSTRTDTRLALAHRLHADPELLDAILRVKMCQEKHLCVQVTPVQGECAMKQRRAITTCREACMVGMDVPHNHAERGLDLAVWHGQVVLLSELTSLHLGTNRSSKS